jgi:hypothetical protein
MTLPKLEWKNTPDLYNDYVFFEECNRAMQLLLLEHGWMFDDEYFYWLVAGCRIVKRRPLYWYPQKSTPSEKPINPLDLRHMNVNGVDIAFYK